MSRRRLSVVGACGVFFVAVLGGRDASAAALSAWIYGNTRFPGRAELDSWAASLEIVTALATNELEIATENVERATNLSTDQFRAWVTKLRATAPEGTLVFYFGSHQTSDGRIGFADGSMLRCSEFVSILNQCALRRRVVLLMDTCHAAELESAARISSNVYRLYAADPEERAIEATGPRRSPAMIRFFRNQPDVRKSPSLFALLLQRALRNTIDAHQGEVRWTTLTREVAVARDELAAMSVRTRIPRMRSAATADDLLLQPKRERAD